MVGEGFSSLSFLKRSVWCNHLPLSSTAARSVCITQRAEVEQKVSNWAISLRSAVAARSQRWIRSLAAHADARAEKLEASTAKLRASQLRAHIGARPESSSGTPAAPPSLHTVG